MVGLSAQWYPRTTMHPDSDPRAGARRARRYRRAPQPVRFPDSEPVTESKAHFEGRAALFDALKLAFGDRACIGSSQFVYWDPSDPRRSVAPDVFVRVGTPDEGFRTWKVWERGAPQIAVELLSDDDRTPAVWADKLSRYHRMGVAELVSFEDADSAQPLRVWDRVDGDLVERELDEPRAAECGPLGVWWVAVTDARLGWVLRASRDAAASQLLPTTAEAERQAREAEHAALVSRIRQLEAKQDK